MKVHGLLPVEETPEGKLWECRCGYGPRGDSLANPQTIWVNHVAGAAFSAPRDVVDRGEVQYVTMDCGCVVQTPWPTFAQVAESLGHRLLCVNHGLIFCFHVEIGADGMPFFNRSTCEVDHA